RIFPPPGQPRTSAFTRREPRASPVWCCAYERVGEIHVQRVEKIDGRGRRWLHRACVLQLLDLSHMPH
ncbi:hypothetical protein ZWY2020_028840, partial [Hordeum vulgare]